MRALIITQYFWPEDFRINDLTADLISKGYEVSILTGRPNYPEGIIFPEYKAGTKNFKYFNQSRIYRCPIPSRGDSRFRLFLNYLTFVIFGSLYSLVLSSKHKFDFIFVFEPSPISVCIPAIVAKKVFKTPIIFWVLDLWPETLQAVGILKKDSFIYKLILKLVRWIYNNCDILLGQSRSFVKKIKLETLRNQPVLYFPNWVESDFEINVRKELKINKNPKFKLFFAGNIGEAQDFPSILEAIKLIDKDVNFELHIYGDGRKKTWVEKEISSCNLNNIVFLHGRRPQSEMSDILSSADAFLVSLKNDPILDITIPGKLQTYLSLGKPILGMVSGECAELINESKSGYTSPPGDHIGLSKNIARLIATDTHQLTEMGANAVKFSNENFNKEKLMAWLDDLIKKLISK